VWFFSRGPAPASLGRRGEKIARRFLKDRGFTILATNYRCPAGEIDVIALEPSTSSRDRAETLVFAEVKTRSSDKYTQPYAAVDSHKQRRIRRAAEYYISAKNAGDMPVRFDVVSIVIRKGAQPLITHIPEAF